jgi:hypothetical protein
MWKQARKYVFWAFIICGVIYAAPRIIWNKGSVTPNVYEPSLNYFRMRWFQSDENFTIYWRKPDAWYSDGDNNRWCVKDDKGRWRPFIVEPDD